MPPVILWERMLYEVLDTDEFWRSEFSLGYQISDRSGIGREAVVLADHHDPVDRRCLVLDRIDVSQVVA